MIKQLVIDNFKSHKHTVMDFVPGVNIIIGESDNGKSAVVGAMRWVMENRPEGEGFRSTWGGETAVTIHNDTTTITRGKGKENYYDVSGIHFTAFGTDVPQEVSSALNLLPVNLQTQFKQHYLLTETAGKVAAHFNKIAHIDLIDKSIEKVNSWIKSLDNKITTDTESMVSNRKKLTQYDYLETMEIDLEVLEQLEQDIQTKYRSYRKLQSYISQIEVTEHEIEIFKHETKKEKDVENLLILYKSWEDQQDQSLQLASLIIRIERTEQDINEYHKLTILETVLNPVIDLQLLVEENLKIKNRLYQLVVSINMIQTEIKNSSQEIIRLQKEFNTEMPDICPLCDTPILNKHEHI